MIDRSNLILRLRADAADLESANARHEPPDRVLVASAVNLMMGAAEALASQGIEIGRLRAVGGTCTMREIYISMRSLGQTPLEVAGLMDRIEELKSMDIK